MRRTWRNSSGAACGIRFTMILILMLVMVFGAAGAVFADDTVTVEVRGLYKQTEARSMLQRINDFRTGRYVDGGQSAPWAYDQNGQVDTASYQGLGELQYDYELEKAAMQRAIETTLRFSHTRPNNQGCDSVMPSGYTASGENIAYGYGSSSPATAIQAFDQWAELDEPYSGQGHRRNMLGRNFNRIGIACVKIHFKGQLEEGTRPYNLETDIYYWVQVLGRRDDNFGLTLTTPLDTSTVRSVYVLKSNVVANNIKLDSNELTMNSGESYDYNDAHCGVRFSSTLPDKFNVLWTNGDTSIGTYYVDIEDAYSLSSAQPTIASVSGKTITANSPGTTTLTVRSVFGTEKAVNLTVNSAVKDINDQNIILSNTSFTYNGSNQKPSVTVKDDATTLVEGTDYTLTNNGGTNVGTYNVVVTGTGNYTGSAQKSFSITAKKVAVPTAATGLTYTGQTQQGVAATADYTVSNGSATNAGNYTATLTLKDNTNTTWSDGGTANKTVQWSIAPKSVTTDMITLSHDDFTYNGSNQKPSVTVKDGATTLVEGTDYTLTNNGGTNVGTYNVVVTGTGNYTGSAQKSYSITRKEITANMVELSSTEFIENGNQHKPEVTVRDGEKILVEDSDYMLNNEGGKVIGTYNVVVKGRGNYRGEVTKQFSIEEPKTLIPIPSPKTGLVYNGGPQKGFDESPYYSITNGEQTDAGAYTATLELTDKTGTTWDDGGTTNKEVQWSIASKSVTESMITLSPTSFTYNGSTQMPEVTVEDGSETLTKDTDYTLTNAGGTDVGTYTVSIAGKGNYSGNTSAAFEIAKAPNEITKFIVTGGTEGSNPFTITLESKFGKDTAVYTFSTSVDGDYTNTRPTKKGTYYAKVSIAETANYSGAKSGPIAFTISASRQDETETIPKKGSDPNQKGEDGTATGAGASAAAAEKAITGAKNDNDPAGSVFGKLRLKSNKQTKHAITLNWTKQKDAVKYVVYGNVCGKKNNMKKLVTLDNKNAYTVKKISNKLKKGTYHKFIVVALDENETVVSTSKIIHVATKGGKVTNPKSVKVEKGKKAVSKLSVKAGKTAKLKGSVTKAGKNLQLKKYRAVVFETSNKEIATVSKSGKITAKDKGICDIYAYAQDGKFKTIKLTVK